uniref:Uncharacterized protein n=1 Tax=Sphenodon punctatus TaxID=8508 RepID=A0A8D0HEF6_SPHPU
MKSNILKAQAEAVAVHKVTREDSTSSCKNSNVQEAAARGILVSGKVPGSPQTASSPLFQKPRQLAKTAPTSNAFLPNALNEDNAASSPEAPLIPANLAPAEEAAVLKSSVDDLDVLLTSLTENLIDFTEAIPRVSSPSTITPRWIVPSGLVSNGPLGNDVALALKAVKSSSDVLPLSTGSPPPPQSAEILNSPVAEDATLRPKCLLTTEL